LTGDLTKFILDKLPHPALKKAIQNAAYANVSGKGCLKIPIECCQIEPSPVHFIFDYGIDLGVGKPPVNFRKPLPGEKVPDNYVPPIPLDGPTTTNIPGSAGISFRGTDTWEVTGWDISKWHHSYHNHAGKWFLALKAWLFNIKWEGDF
jgi:hypothetical protein